MSDLWLPGRPIAWARTTHTNGRRITPKRYREWKDSAGWSMRIKGEGPLQGDVRLDILVTSEGVQVVASDAEASRVKHVRGDIDNYAKAVMDAGNGLLYEDDRQVTELSVRFGPRPPTH